MGHLQHLHTVQVPCGGDTRERGVLGITREQCVEAAPPHAEHHTRVVGVQLLLYFPGRPHHLDGGGTETPRLSRRDAPHHLRSHHPCHHAARCGEPLGGDSGDSGPTDIHHATQAGHPSRMVVVRVREHQHIHGTHPLARQCAPKHSLIGTGVHEHGPSAVTYDDGVTLADVEHGDRHLMRHRWTNDGGDRTRQRTSDEQTPLALALRARPPQPHQQRTEHRTSDHQRGSSQRDRRAWHLGKAA